MSEDNHDTGLFGLIKSDELGREVFIVLLIKLILIVLLWWFFFNLPDDHALDAGDMDQKIVGVHAAAQSPEQQVNP